MRILVAEDDPTIRQLMAILLTRAGIDCVTVENGRSAIEAWEQETFDVIVMDVQMPVMDGLTATRMIREMEVQRGGHIPIIAVTAHAMAEDREQCLASGMDDYLSKPIDVEQLFSILGREYTNSTH